MKDFRLPDPGEGLVEADIVTWRVAEGDQVKINDIVVEVETSKSLVELPIPFAGTVAKLLVAEGDTVDVGAPIITIDDGTSAPVAPPAGTPGEDLVPALPAESEADAPESGGRIPVLVGYGPRTTEAKRRPRKAGHDAADVADGRSGVADSFATDHPVAHRPDERHPLTAGQDTPVGAPLPGPGLPPSVDTVPPPSLDRQVLAKPPVRKRAKDLGVDLTLLSGSGEGGIITRADVEGAALRQAQGAESGAQGAKLSPLRQAQGTESGAQGADSGAQGADAEVTRPEPVEGQPPRHYLGEGNENEGPGWFAPGRGPSRLGPAKTIPIKGVRKATARAMVSSAFTAPHVSVWLTCDVTATMELIGKLKTRREFAGIKISPLLIVAKAVCLALPRTRELNSRWDEEAQEITLLDVVNLGIAAATPRGLVVPNIKAAERLGLLDLGAALAELVATARAGKTQPGEMSGGTFSITNIGPLGVDAGTPILNPGESGILCVGTIDRRPWVVGGATDPAAGEERIEPRWVTTLALSFDHRLADGEQGSRFLVDVADILRDPGLALLH